MDENAKKFVKGILKDDSPSKMSMDNLRKWEYELKKVSEQTNHEGLMKCIIKFIDYVINYVSTKSPQNQLVICRRSFSLLTQMVTQELKNAFVIHLTRRIFDIIIEEDANTWCMKRELLKMFNYCIQNSEKTVRHNTVKEFSDMYIYKLVDSISSYGDYDLQVLIIEMVFRMYGKSTINARLKDLIPESQSLSQSFAEINPETFDEDARVFLTEFNKKSGKVVSIISENIRIGEFTCLSPTNSIDGIWVDFNVREAVITWYCSRSSFLGEKRSEEDEAIWDLVTLFASDVNTINIHRSADNTTCIIYCKLKAPCMSCEENDAILKKCDTLSLLLKNTEDTTRLITQILPQMFKEKILRTHVDRKVSTKLEYKSLNIKYRRRSKSAASRCKSNISYRSSTFDPISSKSTTTKNEGSTSSRIQSLDQSRVYSISSDSSKHEVTVDGFANSSFQQQSFGDRQLLSVIPQPDEITTKNLDDDIFSIQSSESSIKNVHGEGSHIQILSGRCSGSFVKYSQSSRDRVSSTPKRVSTYFPNNMDEILEVPNSECYGTAPQILEVQKSQKVSTNMEVPSTESYETAPQTLQTQKSQKVTINVPHSSELFSTADDCSQKTIKIGSDDIQTSLKISQALDSQRTIAATKNVLTDSTRFNLNSQSSDYFVQRHQFPELTEDFDSMDVNICERKSGSAIFKVSVNSTSCNKENRWSEERDRVRKTVASYGENDVSLDFEERIILTNEPIEEKLSNMDKGKQLKNSDKVSEKICQVTERVPNESEFSSMKVNVGRMPDSLPEDKYQAPITSDRQEVKRNINNEGDEERAMRSSDRTASTEERLEDLKKKDVPSKDNVESVVTIKSKSKSLRSIKPKTDKRKSKVPEKIPFTGKNVCEQLEAPDEFDIEPTTKQNENEQTIRKEDEKVNEVHTDNLKATINMRATTEKSSDVSFLDKQEETKYMKRSEMNLDLNENKIEIIETNNDELDTVAKKSTIEYGSGVEQNVEVYEGIRELKKTKIPDVTTKAYNTRRSWLRKSTPDKKTRVSSLPKKSSRLEKLKSNQSKQYASREKLTDLETDTSSVVKDTSEEIIVERSESDKVITVKNDLEQNNAGHLTPLVSFAEEDDIALSELRRKMLKITDIEEISSIPDNVNRLPEKRDEIGKKITDFEEIPFIPDNVNRLPEEKTEFGKKRLKITDIEEISSIPDNENRLPEERAEIGKKIADFEEIPFIPDNVSRLPEEKAELGKKRLKMTDIEEISSLLDNVKPLPEGGSDPRKKMLKVTDIEEISSIPDNLNRLLEEKAELGKKTLKTTDIEEISSIPVNVKPLRKKLLKIADIEEMSSIPVNVNWLPEEKAELGKKTLKTTDIEEISSIPVNVKPLRKKLLKIADIEEISPIPVNVNWLPEEKAELGKKRLKITDIEEIPDNVKPLPKEKAELGKKRLKVTGTEEISSIPDNVKPVRKKLLKITDIEEISSIPDNVNRLPEEKAELGKKRLKVTDIEEISSIPDIVKPLTEEGAAASVVTYEKNVFNIEHSMKNILPDNLVEEPIISHETDNALKKDIIEKNTVAAVSEEEDSYYSGDEYIIPDLSAPRIRIDPDEAFENLFQNSYRNGQKKFTVLQNILIKSPARELETEQGGEKLESSSKENYLHQESRKQDSSKENNKFDRIEVCESEQIDGKNVTSTTKIDTVKLYKDNNITVDNIGVVDQKNMLKDIIVSSQAENKFNSVISRDVTPYRDIIEEDIDEGLTFSDKKKKNLKFESPPPSSTKKIDNQVSPKTKDPNQTLSTTLSVRRRRKLYNPDDASFINMAMSSPAEVAHPVKPVDCVDLTHSEIEPVVNKKATKRDSSSSKKKPRKTKAAKHEISYKDVKNQKNKAKQMKIVNLNASLMDSGSKSHLKSMFSDLLESFREEIGGESLVEKMRKNKSGNEAKQTASKNKTKQMAKSKTMKKSIKHTKQSTKTTTKIGHSLSLQRKRWRLGSASSSTSVSLKSVTKATRKRAAIHDDVFDDVGLTHRNERKNHQATKATTEKRINILSDVQIAPGWTEVPSPPKKSRMLYEPPLDKDLSQEHSIEDVDKSFQGPTYSLLISKPAPSWHGTALIDGKVLTIRSTDYLKKYLVLFFYPIDFGTVPYVSDPNEIITFNDRIEDFRKINTEIVCCSVDSFFTHQAWVRYLRGKDLFEKLKIPLLSDANHHISKDFKIYSDQLGHTFRGVFVIDPNGIIIQETRVDLPFKIDVDHIFNWIKEIQTI